MYKPDAKRYETMIYRYCGRSGLKLPVISLGLWHNFGDLTPLETQRQLLTTAFDSGITYFDLADNYGPPYGRAEENFGAIFADTLKPYRDELVIATKAGYDMWAGPYGDGGSRKHLLAGIDASLKRMGLDYVDIFYHHRPDPETPLEETCRALHDIVRQGKALYIGLSNYRPAEAERAIAILRELKTPCLIHQPNYSLLDRWIEQGLQQVLLEQGVGCVAFKPLEQGLLTGKYLHGIPQDSRMQRDNRFLKSSALQADVLRKIQALNDLAQQRGQTLAQMSIAWVLQNPCVTSTLIGASRPSQIVENIQALSNLHFSEEENQTIEAILKGNAT